MKYTAKEFSNKDTLSKLEKGDVFYLKGYNQTFVVLRNIPEINCINANCFWGDSTKSLLMRSSFTYRELLGTVKS